MKKLIIGIAVVAVLAFGTLAFAHSTRLTDQKFLDETADLRRDLHEKRFEYFEIQRDPDTTNRTLANLEKEITELQEKIYANAPRTAYRGSGGYGQCF